jgi:16S rRNA processing protein RimM
MPPHSRRPAFVVTGRVTKPYGVDGWVKVEALTSNPQRFREGSTFILEGDEEGERLCLEEVRESPGVLLVKFRGMATRTQAEELAGRMLFVTPREVGKAPPQSMWEHELLGMEVRTRDGRCLGEVAEVMETGANDVLVVRGEMECLIPFIEDVVVGIDVEAGAITIEPLPGLLEE